MSMTTKEDLIYQQVLGSSKTYMMGVSPYFYVNLPSYGKNWYSSSESLWYDRWQQVLQLSPPLVQIITCASDPAVHPARRRPG
jgi:glucan endo-1,3-alpha-glucosidase